MTVRAWFTISGLVVAALFAAVAIRFFAPTSAGPPAIIARANGTRLDGRLTGACWPQRGAKVSCSTRDGEHGERRTIGPTGRFHVVVGYPVQPKRGTIRIVRSTGRVVKKRPWDGDFAYKLKPGTYRLEAIGRFPNGVYVGYRFDFKVTRSGS